MRIFSSEVPFAFGLGVLGLFQRPFEVEGQTSFCLRLFDSAASPPQPYVSPWSLTAVLGALVETFRLKVSKIFEF